MNKVQKEYIHAMRTLEIAEENMAAEEAAFLARKRRPETRLYEIEDDKVFDALLIEFFEEPEIVSMSEDIEAKRDKCKAAEEALIEYALEISPPGVRDTLREGAATQVKIRRRLIELVMALNTATVR